MLMTSQKLRGQYLRCRREITSPYQAQSLRYNINAIQDTYSVTNPCHPLSVSTLRKQLKIVLIANCSKQYGEAQKMLYVKKVRYISYIASDKWCPQNVSFIVRDTQVSLCTSTINRQTNRIESEVKRQSRTWPFDSYPHGDSLHNFTPQDTLYQCLMKNRFSHCHGTFIEIILPESDFILACR